MDSFGDSLCKGNSLRVLCPLVLSKAAYRQWQRKLAKPGGDVTYKIF